MNRRDVLKSLVALPAAALPLAGVPGPAAAAPVPFVPVRGQRLRELEGQRRRQAERLARLARAWCADAPEARGRVCEVPFVSTPASVYLPRGHAGPPGLQPLVDGLREHAVCGPSLWELQRAQVAAFELRGLPAGITYSASRCLDKFGDYGGSRPGRLITPRYAIDAAELSTAGLAFLIDSCWRLADELHRKTAVALQLCAAQGRLGKSSGVCTRPQTYYRREAYLITSFCWVEAAATVAGGAKS